MPTAFHLPTLPPIRRHPRARTLCVALSVLASIVVLAGSSAARAAETNPGAPHLVVSPTSLHLVNPGDSASVVLRNAGDRELVIGAVTTLMPNTGAAPEFLTTPVSNRRLEPGQTVTFTVSYRPSRSPAPNNAQALGAVLIEADDARLPQTTLLSANTPGTNHLPAHAVHVASIPVRGGPAETLLSWLIFSPLFGIPFLLMWPQGPTRDRYLRWIALGAAAIPLVLVARLLLAFDPTVRVADGNFGFQFVHHAPWLSAFSAEYYVGVDGLSVGLVALTALIGFIAVLASWSIPVERNLRGYFALLLLLETGLLGVFMALDLFLFYVFWEVVLLPIYFLVGLWGGPRKEYAAIKFFLYTLVGSVLILLAILALYYASAPTFLIDGTPAAHTLNINKLAHLNDFANQPALLGLRFVHVVWVFLFIGFAIKVPMVPFHTWLPDAHVQAPTAISVVLAGVLLKMGTYGMLRISWAILPEATHWAAPAIAIFGVIGVVYGGLCALAQTDLKSLVAYSSVSHMGYCLLGMAALTPMGIEGAVFQMLSHGIISALLFLLVGVLYDRTHERGLDAFGGVATAMPRYAGVFGLAFMASLGLPGLSGFIGELMTLLGSFGPFRVCAAIASTGLVIGAAYNLWAIRRVQFGVLPERWRAALVGHDLTLREWASVLPLVVLTIVLGFYPMPLLTPIRAAVFDLLTVMGMGFGPRGG